jgi:hypothetical protein
MEVSMSTLTRATRRWRDGGSRRTEGSLKTGSYFRAFQLRREVFRKSRKEALKTILEVAL